MREDASEGAAAQSAARHLQAGSLLLLGGCQLGRSCGGVERLGRAAPEAHAAAARLPTAPGHRPAVIDDLTLNPCAQGVKKLGKVLTSELTSCTSVSP